MLLLEAPTVPIDILIDIMRSYVTAAFCSSLSNALKMTVSTATALMAIIVLAIAVQFIVGDAAGVVRQIMSGG